MSISYLLTRLSTTNYLTTGSSVCFALYSGKQEVIFPSSPMTQGYFEDDFDFIESTPLD